LVRFSFKEIFAVFSFVNDLIINNNGFANASHENHQQSKHFLKKAFKYRLKINFLVKNGTF